jgi:putrescine transport system substrate-binding protein
MRVGLTPAHRVAVLAGLVLAITLPGCAGRDASVVNFYTWSDYAMPETLRAFEAETGIRVNVEYFDTNAILETRLLAGASGYDVVAPGSGYLAKLVPAGVFAPLDRERLPNLARLDPAVVARLARQDPGNRHAVPYVWGTTGIAFDAAKLRARAPDAPLDSWALVLDPEVVARFADCGVGIPDSPIAMVPVVLAWLGLDPETGRAEDLSRVEAALAPIRPHLRRIANSGLKEDFTAGELCLVVIEDGAARQAAAVASESGRAFELGFSLPREGAMGWIDTLAIPADAPHPGEAHRLIDFLLRDEAAVEAARQLRFATGNAAGTVALAGATVAPHGPLFIDAAVSDEYTRLRSRMWTRFRTGG